MQTQVVLGILAVIGAISTSEARRVKRQFPGDERIPDFITSVASTAAPLSTTLFTSTLPNDNQILYQVLPGNIERNGAPNQPSITFTLDTIFASPTEIQSEESAKTTIIALPKKDVGDATPMSAGQSSGGKSNTGAIVGGVVGGVLVLALMTLAIFWFVFRRKPKNDVDRTESALALEKLGSDSPESPLDGVNPPVYPPKINTSGSLPPPPAPPQKQSSGSPISQRLDHEQPLPPVPRSEYHGSGDREDSHLLHHRSQDPDSLLPPLPAAPKLPHFNSGPALSMNSTNRPTAPPPPPLEPAELLSREVDNDGVSVRSFDLEREMEHKPAERSVPRLPIYQKLAGGSDGLPGQAL